MYLKCFHKESYIQVVLGLRIANEKLESKSITNRDMLYLIFRLIFTMLGLTQGTSIVTLI